VPVPLLLSAGAGLLAVPVVAVTMFLGSGAADPPPAGTVCTLMPVTTTGAGAPLMSSVLTLTGEQAGNARVIVAAAKALGLSREAAAIAVMTGRQESGLLVLANPAVPGSSDHPHQGSGSDHDSVGLFQQRPSQGWGTVGQLMDPGYAATTFLRSLVQVPGWQHQPLWQAAQAVQRSADGTAYAQWTALGTAAADALWDHTSGALTCTTVATSVSFGGAGGGFPAQACSVVPDPSTGTGCLTPRMAALYTQLVAQGWHPDCYRPSDPVAHSDHPLGRACDAPPGSYGVLPTAAQKAAGDALAASLQASAGRTGVHYLIWYGRIWNTERAREGWRPYTGAGVYNTTPSTPDGITGGHYDHVHISVY